MKIIENIQQFLIGWRFPVMMVSMLLFFSLELFIVLLIPASSGAAAQFAEDFKTWCFGYDPATGKLEWGYVIMFLIQPLMMCGVIIMVWIKPLKEVWQDRPTQTVPYLVSSATIVLALGVSLTLMVGADARAADEQLPFPAEALRTELNPIPFSLMNQDSAVVSLESLKGRVTLITAVYARCGYTCPMILAQTRRVMSSLTPQELKELSILGITLDPEHDDVAVLREMAAGQQVKTPLFHFLTGESAYVNQTLDMYGFARKRNPETGVIDHANLFLLIDRQGKIAYRFSIGKRQEDWLVHAIRMLIKEKKGSGVAA